MNTMSIKLGFLFLFHLPLLLISNVKLAQSKCQSTCDLALASYYVWPGATLGVISNYLDATITDIMSYNPKIPNQDSIETGTRINVPFPCGCVNDTFLGHIFKYTFRKDDNYYVVARGNYSNLTNSDWVQQWNHYDPLEVPIGAVVNIPVNCSCGDSRVSKDYGLFVTYPLRPEDTLESISMEFGGFNETLLQEYNPGVDFSAGSGLVYIPAKDKSGNYPRWGSPVSNSSGQNGNGPPSGSDDSNGPGFSGGVIAGISIAAVVVLISLSLGLYFGCTRRKKMKEPSLVSVKPDYQRAHSDSVSQAGHIAGIVGVIVEKSVEFSYEELAKATNNFNISYKIGQGGFGAVFYGELRGKEAAIKKMDMKASKEFLAELKVLTHVHHLNLVCLLGYCVEESLCLVYEYVGNGNLSQHLRSSGVDPLSWSSRVQIALDSARGLEYIHEHTVPVYVHRDIKPANILIDKNFRAKVADFGLAKLTEVGNATLPTRLVGTFGYMPPEYTQFGEVSPKVDVYAFGVVLFELISAKDAVLKGNSFALESQGLVTLFEDVLNLPDANEICKLVDPRLGDDYPPESVRQVAELAKACTQENPQLRPSMRSVVVALTALSSTSQNWNGGLRNRVSGR